MGSREDEILVIIRQTAGNLARTAEDRRLFSAQFDNFDMSETIESDRVIEDEASTPDKQVWGDPELCALFDGLTRGQVTPTLRKNSAYDMDYVLFKLMLHYLGGDLALAYKGCLGVAQGNDLKVRVGKPTTHYRRGTGQRWLSSATLHLTKFFLVPSDPSEMKIDAQETRQNWETVRNGRRANDGNHGYYFLHTRYVSESFSIEVGHFPF